MKSLSLIPWMLLEKLINELLARDPGSLQRRQKLVGKSLRFDIKELPFELAVSIDEYGLRLTTVSEGKTDCWLQTELGVLPELSDSSNLTRLIKAGKLDIEGDPMLAQQLVALIKELDIDWEAELEAKIGAVPALWLSQIWRKSRQQVAESLQQSQRWATGVLIDEKKILPARIEFEQHKQQLQQLRAKIERLERQLREDS